MKIDLPGATQARAAIRSNNKRCFPMCIRKIVSTPIALVLPCLFLAGTSSAVLGDESATTRIAVVAYAANRQSFPFYTCSFTVTRANAASREDAISGRWVNANSTDHKLQVDNDLELYEDLSPPPPAPTAPAALDKRGRGFDTVAGVTHSYLSNGRSELLHTPGMSVINLFNEQQPAPAPKITPWSYGMFGHRKHWFGPDALDANPQEFERLSGDGFGLAQFEGRPVVSVGYKIRSSQEVHRFLLDPAQGYLPVYVFRESESRPRRNGVPPVEALLTQARACSKGRWFPERVLLLQHLGTATEPFVKVTEIKVTALEVDRRPAKDSFAITVPAGTRVCSDLRRHNFVLKQEEKIEPENIPSMFQMMDKAATDPLMDTAIPRPPTSSSWWKVAAISLAVLVMLLCAVRLMRRRALRAHPSVPPASPVG